GPGTGAGLAGRLLPLGGVLDLQRLTRPRSGLLVAGAVALGGDRELARRPRGVVGTVRRRLSGDLGIGPQGAASAPHRAGRVLGGGGVPDREQGLLAAVRALAAAPGGVGPTPVAGPVDLAGR